MRFMGGDASNEPLDITYAVLLEAILAHSTGKRLIVPWTDTGSTLPGVLYSSQCAVIGDYVYLFGGYTSAAVNVIYRAPVSDPTSWTDTGSTLPGVMNNSQCAVIGNYVYLFGGFTSAAVNVIYRAPLDDPTSWTDTGSTLPAAMSLHQCAVIGDYIYLFGGFTSLAVNVIYRAPLDDFIRFSQTIATKAIDITLGRALSKQETMNNKPWRVE